MTKHRETAMMVGHRLDNLGGEPEQIEIYVDNGEWVNPPEPPTAVDPADAPITLTHAELADMIATATTAAIAAHSRQADTSTVRAAALSAIEDQAG